MSSDVNSLIAALERGKAVLAECRDNADRLYIRDQAKAAQAAAEVLKRKDIATTASLLVTEAERAIVQATPPAQGKRNDLTNFVGEDDEVRRTPVIPALRDMRMAHAISDGEWESRKVRAVEIQTPVTRAGLIRENTGRTGRTVAFRPGPTHTSRPLPDGSKIEVTIAADGETTVDRTGATEWGVTIAANGTCAHKSGRWVGVRWKCWLCNKSFKQSLDGREIQLPLTGIPTE